MLIISIACPVVYLSMNYTPLKLPLKGQSTPSAGLIPVVTFSVLLIAGAVITGALLFSSTSAQKAQQKVADAQKYTIAHSTNLAATVSARAAQGVNAPTITDTPKNGATVQPTGVVAGASTQNNFFTPNYNAQFPKCFDSAAVNPGTDVSGLAVRCPIYLPRAATREALSFMEDGNAISLIDGGTVVYTLKKTAPEGQPAPVCVTVNDYVNSGANPATKKECTMVRVKQNTHEVKVDKNTAASSIVENMKCDDETEASCTISSVSVVIPVDGGLSLVMPSSEEAQDIIELERVK